VDPIAGNVAHVINSGLHSRHLCIVSSVAKISVKFVMVSDWSDE
jgi:hypothetical protein